MLSESIPYWRNRWVTVLDTPHTTRGYNNMRRVIWKYVSFALFETCDYPSTHANNNLRIQNIRNTFAIDFYGQYAAVSGDVVGRCVNILVKSKLHVTNTVNHPFFYFLLMSEWRLVRPSLLNAKWLLTFSTKRKKRLNQMNTLGR